MKDNTTRCGVRGHLPVAQYFHPYTPFTTHPPHEPLGLQGPSSGCERKLPYKAYHLALHGTHHEWWCPSRGSSGSWEVTLPWLDILSYHRQHHISWCTSRPVWVHVKVTHTKIFGSRPITQPLTQTSRFRCVKFLYIH